MGLLFIANDSHLQGEQMKKLLSIALFIFLLVGCSSNARPVNNNEIKIVTTIFPITDLTQKVTGESVTQLLPDSGANAHTWEPTPQDIFLLEEADVFIYNGAGMEEWVEDVLDSLGNEELLVIEASKDVAKIDGHGHAHAGVDPHTWSSPKTAKTQLETIGQALMSEFEDKADDYKKNIEKTVTLFEELDKEYETALKDLPNRILVVQHEAYGYLTHDYGLQQIGIEGLVPTSEPDPARMVDIIKLVKEYNVKTIFFEENVSDRVAQTLANETGADTAVLNTLAFKNENNDDLIQMMRNNLQVLVEGLEQ